MREQRGVLEGELRRPLLHGQPERDGLRGVRQVRDRQPHPAVLLPGGHRRGPLPLLQEEQPQVRFRRDLVVLPRRVRVL